MIEAVRRFFWGRWYLSMRVTCNKCSASVTWEQFRSRSLPETYLKMAAQVQHNRECGPVGSIVEYEYSTRIDL